jgi:hypothetical protein
MRYSIVCWCIHKASDELSVMRSTRTGRSHAGGHANCFEWTTNQTSVFIQKFVLKMHISVQFPCSSCFIKGHHHSVWNLPFTVKYKSHTAPVLTRISLPCSSITDEPENWIIWPHMKLIISAKYCPNWSNITVQIFYNSEVVSHIQNQNFVCVQLPAHG